MARLAIQALVVAYLPGAVLFRWPGRSQSYRATLSYEERVFWSVVLSTLWSLMLVLGLGALNRYSFDRLLIVNALVAGLAIVTLRGRLAYRNRATRPSWAVLIPVALVVLGSWLYFPPAEYVIGGKDPGTYINEGVQLAQRGQVIARDADVIAVPRPLRDLFFPSHNQATYYGLRFMGFFIQDPDDGRVVGQFPHLYPASIAVGYGLNGLSGARQAVGVWAILGLLAVYFAGSRLFGKAAAGAAATLLALNIVEVWFGRYPNSEMAMQALIFSALLAAGRSRDGGGAFFGIVAGAVLGLTLFLRYEILLAFAAFAAAGVLAPVTRAKLGWPFRTALSVTSGVGLWYLSGPMRAYFAYPIGFLNDRGGWLVALAAVVAAGVVSLVLHRQSVQTVVRRWLPLAMSVTLAALAIYAYFFRVQEGKTALGDAIAFRSFGWYITPWALGLAAIGAVVLTATRFWRDPPFYLTFATFSVFFFYKTRIVAEHFWTSRRFLGVALPGALLLLTGFIAACVSGLTGAASGAKATEGPPSHPLPRWAQIVTVMVLALVTVPIGVAFWRAADPVRHHVEYAGLIPHLEQLAGRIGDDDLVIVESRNSGSDLHVLAMPLAYIYARHVLVLDSAAPEKRPFETFVAWARTRYRDVFFLGGGGTDLLTREVTATPVASDRFQVPEYDSPVNAYPSGVKSKEFEFGLYRLLPAAAAPPGPIDLQIGGLDDLNVVRFHARERRPETGMTFRWTQGQSFILLIGLASEARSLTIWMSNGGRPAKAPPANVEIALDDQILGTALAVDEVRPYRFSLPATLVERLAAAADPVRLRIRVPQWNPSALIGGTDTRDLGVIVTRVEVR